VRKGWTLKATITITAIILMAITVCMRVEAQTSILNITAVSWRSTAGTPIYPGSQNTILRVEAKHVGGTAIQACTARITPPNGVNPSYGYGYTVPARTANGTTATITQPGETIYFEWRLDVDRSVKPGNYTAKITVSYRENGQPKEEEYNVTLTVNPYPKLIIAVLEAKLTPSNHPDTLNTNIQVTLRNNGEATITGGTAKIQLPTPQLTPKEVSTNMPNTPIGGTSTLTFNGIDISSQTQPGTYQAQLTINATMQTRDGITYNENGTATLTLKVEEATLEMKQAIKPVTVQWGTTQPTPTYQQSRYIALQITVMNVWERDAQGIIVEADSPWLNPIKPVDTYQGRITTGGTFTATLYYDIKPEAPQTITVNVKATYWLDMGGGTMTRTTSTNTIIVNIEGKPRGGGISVVAVQWQNNMNVYPNTENATLQITITNNNPYNIRGIHLKLKPPNGIREAEAYINGPIQPYTSTTANLRTSIADIQPGKYKAKLEADYIMDTGGPGTRIMETHEIELQVMSDREAIEVISVEWPEGSCQPGTYGATLKITIRVNTIDQLKGPTMIIQLPQGFTDSKDNKSRTVIATPTQPQQRIALETLTPEEIAKIMQQTQQATPQQTYTRGDIITFQAKINVQVNKTGTYTANTTITYIDGWGTRRSINKTIEIPVLGGARSINVEVEGRLVQGRQTTLNLTVTCNGTAPAYNVYIDMTPTQANPILIASPSKIYIEKLEPNKQVKIPVKFTYNPQATQTALGATTTINYGVTTMTMRITYKDPAGNEHTYQHLTAIAIQPYIDLTIKDLKAEEYGGTVRITGTIINYGSATAYRVKAQYMQSETYIGDIEPGGEAAFKIEASSTGSSKATIEITYQNAFNEKETIKVNATITRIQEVTPPQQQQPTRISWTTITIIAATTIFLAIAATMIYKMYKAYTRKMREEWKE
jgi:hypothetical protein